MRSIILGAAAIVITAAHAGEGGKVRLELTPLEFLVGSCWQGEFPDGNQIDTHCFDAVYDGAHIRDRHAVTGGPSVYLGETIYSWNGEAEAISYVYWNSLGGVSTGTATPTQGLFSFPNETYKGPNGEEILVSASWENIDSNGYDSLSVETYSNGQTRERRVRYHKRPFTTDPANAR